MIIFEKFCRVYLGCINDPQQHPSEVFCKKSALKNFANFTGKHLCWGFFLIKLQAFRPGIFLKRDSNTGVFMENLKIFKNTYFEDHLRTTTSGSLQTCMRKQLMQYIIDVSWLLNNLKSQTAVLRCSRKELI